MVFAEGVEQKRALSREIGDSLYAIEAMNDAPGPYVLGQMGLWLLTVVLFQLCSSPNGARLTN